MKLLGQCFLIILIISFVTYGLQSCDNKVTMHTKEPNKQERTVVLYWFDIPNNDARVSQSVRLVVDTFKMTITDTTNGKQVSEKAWTKDTFYFVRIWDTARDQKTGKILLDSANKPKGVGWYWPELPKNRLIEDKNKSW